jgi:hypothetical protein
MDVDNLSLQNNHLKETLDFEREDRDKAEKEARDNLENYITKAKELGEMVQVSRQLEQ